MTFSVIICTYNAKEKLPRTLDSLLIQTYEDFEVVIIDGASTDGTVEVIRGYEKKFNGKIKWISEKDSGIYNAMNKGVLMACGEYLNVVGAGDWLEKNALEIARECIVKNPQIDAVHGKLRIWDKEIRNSYLLQSLPSTLAKDPMQHPALYYKKTLHDIYGLYDESYKIVADYLFCMKAFLCGSATAIVFEDVVDNYVTDGISSTETAQCEKENDRARGELGLNPLVSVIMPTYNQGAYIAKSLDSVAKQIYQNWECIVVDDGSKDDTEKIVKNIIKKDSRFKYIKQGNLGPSSARNAGILQSSGKYILPLDSDDIISPRYIQEAINVFVGNDKMKLVYCEAEFFGEKSGKWELPNYSFDKLLFSNMIFCSAVYRKSDYDKTKGYNENMREGLEDWDFWLSFLEKDDLVYKIPETHFFYRIKKSSRNADSHNDSEVVQKMYKRIYLNHEEKYRDIINPIYMQNQIDDLERHIELKNKEIDKLKKQLKPLVFFVDETISLTRTFINKTSSKVVFVLLHPGKFFKKYLKLIRGSNPRKSVS
jgi:glycosyltransferase involved in cell wall biosynthesis